MRNLSSLLPRTGWLARGLDLLVGIIAIFGHAPFHFWPLTIACLVYLFWRLDAMPHQKFKHGFGRGFWFALGLFMASTYWIASAFSARGPEFVWLAPPMVFGLAFAMALFWGLAGGVFTRFKPKGIAKVGLFVGLFFLAEFGRGHAFGGFPWNLIGYTFEAGGAFSQFASIGGVYGVSFILLIISAIAACTLKASRPIIPAGLSAALLMGLFGFGALRLSNAETDFAEGPLIRIVQVQFDQKDQFDAAKSVEIVNQFLTETIAPGINEVTHVIWPEGAVSGLAVENENLIRAMGDILAQNSENPPYWLINSLRHEGRIGPDGELRDEYYNTAATIAFDRSGVATVIDYNDKVRLVPFGEFIPFEGFIKAFGPQTLSTSLASITPGDVKMTSLIPGLPRVSPQICYEIVFQGLTPRSKGKDDPKWILNQSNDAWYGNSLGPRQHANIAQYRAIEEGLPVIRAASNGISGSIDPYGRFVAQVGMSESRPLDIQLPVSINKPIFFAGSKWFLLLINIILCLICASISRDEKHADNSIVQ